MRPRPTILIAVILFVFFCEVRAAMGQGGSAQAVVWTSLVNTTASGGTLQKTSGCNGCPDAGALSQQSISSAGGYFEFTISGPNGQRLAGLGSGDASAAWQGIDYAFRLWGASRDLDVYEKGTYHGLGATYADGDVLRVAVEGGAVKYYKNGALLYTSTVAPTFPLVADASLYETNDTINSAVISASSSSTDPELPRVFLDTTYPTNTGNTIHVAAGGDLQTAINNANPGDTITLEAGATFTGSFTLPHKANPNNYWIIIRSDSTMFDSAGSVPPNTRVNGADAAQVSQMPKIRTNTNAVPAIVLASSSVHYRLVGLDVGAQDTVTQLYSVIAPADDTWNSLDTMASDIVIDRCYIHGNDPGNTRRFRRGVLMNGKRMSVIDSYVSNFFDVDTDAQAVSAFNGAGPFKIVNNYLEASDENIMFGGGNPVIQGLVASDIEIQRNWFFKPLEWKTGPFPRRVKNLFELKSARRVLVNGNLFENCWVSGQLGEGIVIKSAGQDGNCTFCVTEHVTVTNNKIRHVGAGFLINALEAGATLPVNHVKFENNLFYDVGGPTWGSSSRMFSIYNGAQYVTVVHNTADGGSRIINQTSNNPNFTFRDNIIDRQEYGIGAGADRTSGEGTPTLDLNFSPYTFVKNVLVNDSDAYDNLTDGDLAARYPGAGVQTLVAYDWVAVGPVDRANGNYRLAANSPYKNLASDGKDIGADQDAVEAAIGSTGSSAQDVVWTNLVNTTASGGTLQKSSGCSGCPDAGASSQQAITSAGGYFEFTVSGPNGQRVAGLSNGDPGTAWQDIDYAFRLWGASRDLDVYENGVYHGLGVTYADGDVLRVSVEGGVVKYYKNGVLLYTSTVAPTYPLVADTTIYEANNTISNAKIKIN